MKKTCGVTLATVLSLILVCAGSVNEYDGSATHMQPIVTPSESAPPSAITPAAGIAPDQRPGASSSDTTAQNSDAVSLRNRSRKLTVNHHANRKSGRANSPQAIPITINPDGTFNPQNITIGRGGTVRWRGLGRTDAIVQINNPNFATVDACGGGLNPVDHRFDPNDANEFTGPMRNGVSGIFVLGPNGPGFKQVAKTETCRCERREKCDVGEPTIVGELKICRDEGRAYEFLDATWKNPDVTGVIIRLNWKDIQKDTGGQIEFVWTDLDREMDRAVQHGKLFTLDVRAGAEGTPDWIFTTYGSGLTTSDPRRLAPAGPVTPLAFKDWAEGRTPPGIKCGVDMTLGSPMEMAYINLWVAMIRGLADHVASDSRWFQALAHVKVSGANLFSSEARLPNNCLDANLPDADGDGVGEGDGVLDTIVDPADSTRTDLCVCNPQRWAIARYAPPNLFRYYRAVENAIFEAFFRRKSMGYQLIQAGFPRVLNAINFEGDHLRDQYRKLLVRPQGTTADNLDGTIQTETILEEGRRGRFVDPFGLGAAPQMGTLFVPQHSGLQPLPSDADPTARCFQERQLTPAKRASFPIPLPASAIRNNDFDGCPNAWAVREGLDNNPNKFELRLMGFQTTNGHNSKGPVNSPATVESALWNLTLNSNAVFIELYEERVWEIFHRLGAGPKAAVLNPLRRTQFPQPAPYTRNLSAWADDLHDRRALLAATSNNRYLADPFPRVYEHTFSQPINKQVTYYYIIPSKCTTTQRSRRVGSITVNP